MANIQTIKDKIQGLIDKGNEATGNSDVDLTTVMNALIEGLGGSDVKIATGSFKGSTTNTGASVTHNLGIIPDIFIIAPSLIETVDNKLVFAIGFSGSFANGGFGYKQYWACGNGSAYTVNKSASGIENKVNGIFQRANTETLDIGFFVQTSGSTSLRYNWIAIGGLA